MAFFRGYVQGGLILFRQSFNARLVYSQGDAVCRDAVARLHLHQREPMLAKLTTAQRLAVTYLRCPLGLKAGREKTLMLDHVTVSLPCIHWQNMILVLCRTPHGSSIMLSRCTVHHERNPTS